LSNNLDTSEKGIPDDCELACGAFEIGDLDGNGMVDLADITWFTSVAINSIWATVNEFCVTDINQVGNVNGLDISGFQDLLLLP